MKKDEMTSILNFEPGRALRLMILKDVKEKGISIGEACSNYAMPEIYIKDENGMIDFDGQKMTPAQYQEKHPFKRIVTIGTK